MTAPTIRRGPAQRGQARTSTANTRANSVAQDCDLGRRGRSGAAGGAPSGAVGGGTIALRVVPDLMVVAKGMSGGYAPLAGVIASRTVVETIREGSGLFSCWGRCRKGGEGPLR